jgi:hypothetical protein
MQTGKLSLSSPQLQFQLKASHTSGPPRCLTHTVKPYLGPPKSPNPPLQTRSLRAAPAPTPCRYSEAKLRTDARLARSHCIGATSAPRICASQPAHIVSNVRCATWNTKTLSRLSMRLPTPVCEPMLGKSKCNGLAKAMTTRVLFSRRKRLEKGARGRG